MTSRSRVGFVAVVSAVSHCATANADATLYDRIGGERLTLTDLPAGRFDMPAWHPVGAR